ncbi:Tryptophan synthase [Penicillium diatomitis]|uniref:Tryptophan synthase n=1 Tax=Penicillium diatomitis TaxID=2819901 RepID=A0A9W9WRY3_9EURO|nr:Tryptophan synthase [Penicillium diatomitis]KAJ5472157.1 Tryptophan synthase [Penicillium diatomitis]
MTQPMRSTTCASWSKMPFRVVDGPAILTKTAQVSKYNMNDSFTSSNARLSPACDTKNAGPNSRSLTQICHMSPVLPMYYVSLGSPPLGGRFVPELIFGFLEKITTAFESAIGDIVFWKEINELLRSISPHSSAVYQAKKITDHIGRATLWMKREDLEHFDSHKARNIIGQLSLATRMGCKEVVTDCASTKHRKFTAVMCPHLNL